MFTCCIKSFLILFKTITEILFVSLIGVLGVPGKVVGGISSSTNSLFSQSNFKFSSIRFYVRRIQSVSCIVASSQFVAENLFSAPLWVFLTDTLILLMASSNSFFIVTTNNTVVMKCILQLQARTYLNFCQIKFSPVMFEKYHHLFIWCLKMKINDFLNCKFCFVQNRLIDEQAVPDRDVFLLMITCNMFNSKISFLLMI